MPTGYTAGVADGTITDLVPFALQLARGMSALVTMRDDPWDKPIPERFEPRTFNADRLAEAKAEQAGLLKMNIAEAQEHADAAFAKAEAEKAKHFADKDAQRARYQAMIDKVEAWEGAPDGLKSFALQQLRDGMQFDCGDPEDRRYWNEPVKMDGEAWRSGELQRVQKAIDYHDREDAAERERVELRNAWIAQLRKSLAMESGS